MTVVLRCFVDVVRVFVRTLRQVERACADHFFCTAMGIKCLAKLITAYAPKAMKEVDSKRYIGRLIAIDASVMIYQSLVLCTVTAIQYRLQFE